MVDSGTRTPGGEAVIRRAVESDAAALAELGARTFHDTFAAYNRPDDMAAYLGTAFGPERQLTEIRDPAGVTLVAESESRLVAYAQLRRGPPPDFQSGQDPFEIRRFYVDSPWHGTGLAQRLMDRVEEEARAAGGRTLWLGVWERNDRALAFYTRRGFTDVGSLVFMLGSDRQIDRVMAKRI